MKRLTDIVTDQFSTKCTLTRVYVGLNNLAQLQPLLALEPFLGGLDLLLHGHHVDTRELLAGQEFEEVLDDMRAAMEREVPCQLKNPRDSSSSSMRAAALLVARSLIVGGCGERSVTVSLGHTRANSP